MDRIQEKSRLTALFHLDWESSGVQHEEQLWSDQVNLWRDCLPLGLVQQLAGCRAGAAATVPIEAGRFLAPWRKNLQVMVSRQQVYPPHTPAQTITPQPGRFYPQGCLHGVTGVFDVSTDPARCLECVDRGYLFDLNHPLAGRNLHFGLEVLRLHGNSVERGGRCEDWLERISQDGPGMQARYQDRPTDFFLSPGLKRPDLSDDADFYAQPRLVHHLDATARATIGTLYAACIPSGARVLDLMASWVSHLPASLETSSLTVLGLNPVELAANSKASQRIVQDLNQKSQLPFADNSLDAIICTASIEYLSRPLEQFLELQRVLTPGGVLLISFSNRWFPPKAVQIWTELHPFERVAMVLEMFHRTPGLSALHTLSRRGDPRPEDDPHPELPLSDPVFVVWGYKEK